MTFPIMSLALCLLWPVVGAEVLLKLGFDSQLVTVGRPQVLLVPGTTTFAGVLDRPEANELKLASSSTAVATAFVTMPATFSRTSPHFWMSCVVASPIATGDRRIGIFFTESSAAVTADGDIAGQDLGAVADGLGWAASVETDRSAFARSNKQTGGQLVVIKVTAIRQRSRPRSPSTLLALAISAARPCLGTTPRRGERSMATDASQRSTESSSWAATSRLPRASWARRLPMSSRAQHPPHPSSSQQHRRRASRPLPLTRPPAATANSAAANASPTTVLIVTTAQPASGALIGGIVGAFLGGLFIAVTCFLFCHAWRRRGAVAATAAKSEPQSELAPSRDHYSAMPRLETILVYGHGALTAT